MAKLPSPSTPNRSTRRPESTATSQANATTQEAAGTTSTPLVPPGRVVTVTTTTTTTTISTTLDNGHPSAPPTPRRNFTQASHANEDDLQAKFPGPWSFEGLSELEGPGKKSKFVVITKGRRVGIFENWLRAAPFTQECIPASPVYMSFERFEDAYSVYKDCYEMQQLRLVEGYGHKLKVIRQPSPIINVASDSEEEAPVPPSDPTLASIHALSQQLQALLQASSGPKSSSCIFSCNTVFFWGSEYFRDILKILEWYERDSNLQSSFHLPSPLMEHRYHFPSDLARQARANRLRSKAYYAANQARLQKKARERAATRKAQMTAEELAAARALHNHAAARYRERNRRVIRNNAQEYRAQQRHAREVEADEEWNQAELARLETALT